MKKTDFIPTIAPIIQKVNSERGNPLFSSVVIAQAICESAWGQSTIMMKANAIFGIKAFQGWNGKVYNANTKECYDGISYTDINACFRAYDNLEQSINDYFDLICKAGRYSKALHTNSPLECITAIKNGGYATSPTYIQTIMSIINASNLTKYDIMKVENVESNVEKSQDSICETNYIVKPGDTLSEIAVKYNTSVSKLATYNHIENVNLILVGQVIKIPPTNQVISQCTYTVKPGDTLSGIATKYNMKWQKLYEKNKDVIGDNPNLILPGQKLVI